MEIGGTLHSSAVARACINMYYFSWHSSCPVEGHPSRNINADSVIFHVCAAPCFPMPFAPGHHNCPPAIFHFRVWSKWVEPPSLPEAGVGHFWRGTSGAELRATLNDSTWNQCRCPESKEPSSVKVRPIDLFTDSSRPEVLPHWVPRDWNNGIGVSYLRN